VRLHYLDNIRWATVLLVLFYHVCYMFNGVGALGGIAGAKSLACFDAVLYFVYPWFMVLLFLIAGISARYALQKYSGREFIRLRVRKLLVPSTLGLFVLHWITGYLNIKMGGGLTDSNLNHTGIYLYSKGKIMIHLTFDYQSDEGCTTPGQYLRYHRTFQGLTTRELAEKVGVVPATLVLYENDRHPIKHSTAVALANVLGIDRSRLLDEYTVFVDYPYSSLLKKVRRELSFTQMQMAEVIGIGQTTYSGWEREVRVPRRKEHEKILAAMKKLKVDVDTYLCQPNPL